MMPPQDSEKWYYKPSVVLIGLFLLGPFVFPLLWDSPHLSKFWKIVLTAIVIFVTLYSIYLAWDTIEKVWKQMKEAGLINF